MPVSHTGPAQPLAHSTQFRLVLASLLRACLVLALLAGVAWPSVAAAQGAVRLATLQVSLWPEFDQPAMLVILDGRLDASVDLPADLTVRIPARAARPYAVAVTGDDGALLTAAYTTQPAGDDIIVMFQTQSPGFRVEYYDPALLFENDSRQYAFAWQTDYAVAATSVRVQQPVGASELTGEPALTSVGAGQDGLNYYQVDLGALEPGDTAAVRFSYTKTGSALSADALSSGGVASGQGGPVPQTVTPQADNSLPLVVGAIALGLALLGAGIAAYMRSRRPLRATVAARGGRRAGAQAPRRPTSAFCTQCGQPLVAGDRFCRDCGARAAS